ncbi:HAMP domain-containing protein [Paenibacillus sp. LMG 31460]|uniref:histidine kinase n=1 Tax=Paenibacillus germinis TaxID=2654979 RepID=A0ABX1ZGS8_9BACL|nr:HAMP domain-containing sensor histidine kinase [Paenibacillus germinis]NOU91384.1 HAMP domain-containing protein [Paenibacillus germinis]
MNLRHSLLTKYLLIVVAALAIWPLVLPLYYLPGLFFDKHAEQKSIYFNTQKLELMWHEEANKLNGATSEQITNQLRKLKGKYSLATMFWVDASGKTQLKHSDVEHIPSEWTFQDSIKFMEKSVGNGPFTIIAFIGGERDQGIMVFQVPLALTKSPSLSLIDDKYLLVYVFFIFLVFLFISWLFFSTIRKRLVHLQTAMTKVDETGIPAPIIVDKKDEIGDLGSAFNRMINELKNSKKREQEEESLRKELISSLSHDLRTPLTNIQGHTYSLQKENLSSRGRESLQLIEGKVAVLNQLLENLLSYTLLSAGKYIMQKKKTDILRLIRTSAAGWYPVFEKENFEVDVRLPETALIWDVDPQWFLRILDNLFQNVVRHAQNGRYIGIYTEELAGRTAIVIEDKGPGMKENSDQRGAGIGLSIVSLMLQEMDQEWKVSSSTNGTRIHLFKTN